MKIGLSSTMLRLFCCAMVLFPDFCIAGSVRIPGYYSGAVTAPQPVQTATHANIPGFYNNRVLPDVTSDAIPELKGAIQGTTDPTTWTQKINAPGGYDLTVAQTQSQAIIDWWTFNIGDKSSVYFNQQGNSSWVVLNRIWDANPSQIFGTLRADGKVYLINQNGILFWPGSKVNVNSLVASALNITNKDFLNNTLHFYVEKGDGTTADIVDASGTISNTYYSGITYSLDNATGKPNAVVSNHGDIEAYTSTVGSDGTTAIQGGYAFLIGPSVENNGIIKATTGQIGLAAGTQVTLQSPADTDTARAAGYYYVLIGDDFSSVGTDNSFGKAVNLVSVKSTDGNSTGLYADGGMVGMYGSTVEQWGIIRSTTAYRDRQGQVELRAANKVITGADSRIDLPVDNSIDPATNQIRTVSDTFNIQPIVDIKGLFGVNNNGDILPENSVKQIELHGEITAPTGQVTLKATDRVYMETDSTIDVSGVIANLPVPVISDYKLTSLDLRDAYGQKTGIVPGTKITTTVMNGSSIGDVSQVTLTRDRTALERSIGGAMRKITATGADGKSYWIYDTQRGSINIQANDGDIIIKPGAALNFSGGYINYIGGFVDSTKLLSGMKIYDISNAPLNIRYDMILGQYTKTNGRFGVAESYSGLYYGGASPLNTYVKSYRQGGDAGSLTLNAKNVVLDGQLDGSVTRGIYQNNWTLQGSFVGDNADYNYSTAKALSKARGLEAPDAGTLAIGDSGINPSAISIVASTSSREDLSPDSPPLKETEQTTVLSAKTLNDANLGGLNLTADLTISTASDVHLSLQPGGYFSATARRIEHDGEIKAPAGTIAMKIVQNTTSVLDVAGNINPNPIALQEMIVLAPGSSLDVSGERIDNTIVGKTSNAVLASGRTQGGGISILDQTDLGSGVFIQAGAVVDVSGGYTIDQRGNVKGGNAGTLSIQGSNILLNGDLRGYALDDATGKILGGAITLASKEIHVFDHTSTLQDPKAGTFYLSDNRFDDTGFAQITLNSVHDLVIGENAHFYTSLVRLKNPSPMDAAEADGAVTYGNAVTGRPNLVRLDNAMAFMAGPSSFTAAAGVDFQGAGSKFEGNLAQLDHRTEIINVSEGAVVRTAPAVSSVTRIGNSTAVKTNISLSAPGTIEVAGKLDSPGGNITANTTFGDVLVLSGAEILASGYNRPDPSTTPKGFAMNYLPVGAGSVTLAAAGKVQLDAGSYLDISGSDAVENRMRSSDGTVVTFREAGNPGTLSFAYGTDLVWNGTVNAGKASMDGLSGAALTINRTDSNNGLVIDAAAIRCYQDLGFDDLTLKSRKSLIFSDAMTAMMGRKLTLDAPMIEGSNASVTLQAPWIVLTNTSVSTAAPLSSPMPISFTLEGQWIDLIGLTQVSGFQDVNLTAVHDIRLNQALYADSNPIGALKTTGNLTLDAERVYPGNFYSFKNGNIIYPDLYSDYTVNAGGKVTIQHTKASGPAGGPIYSARGSLLIEGDAGIEVKDDVTIAAPMGSITLSAPGQRIYVGGNSTITTAGNAAVEYGIIDSNNVWVTQDKTNPQGADAASSSLFNADSLTKNITLTAGETIIGHDATIDVSGGGSVFAYKFQPGAAGSIDPLTKTGRYIVFKDNGVRMPGPAVYLNGGGGLSAGLYTLLPLDSSNPQNARYAFLPGAYILDTQSGSTVPVANAMTSYGYPLVVGYTATADTAVRGARPQIYSVRTAADVLTEGQYLMPGITAGNGGNVSIAGSTTVVDGRIKAAASAGYTGGKISLSATNIYVQSAATSPLPSTFGFNTSFDSTADLQKLKNSLTISAGSLSGNGFQEVDLGDSNTQSVTIRNGSVLDVGVISLNANKTATSQLSIERGVQLGVAQAGTGLSGADSINLTTTGHLLVDDGATVHAKNNITLDVNNVDDIRGTLQVDNSSITLKSSEIYFGDRGTGNGLYVTSQVWNRFSGYNDIAFISKSDIQFLQNTSLSTVGSLTFDSYRIVGMNSGGTSVVVSAPTVNFKNSGTSYLGGGLSAGTASAAFAVQDSPDNSIKVTQINVGNGDVLFAGFNTIALNSHGELTFKGAGSLATGNADLQITAARITTANDKKADSTYQAANFRVVAGLSKDDLNPSKLITMTNSENGQAGTTDIAGGMLEFAARKIEVSTVIQEDAGTIKLTTAGAKDSNGNFLPATNTDDGILLHAGGRILAVGTDNAPGGHVLLATDFVDGAGNIQSGKILLEAGSLIDVSAGRQGDAGLISLSAPIYGVTIAGTLRAKSTGKGGSFLLNTNQVSDFGGLNANLGDFTESIDIRARRGIIDVTSDSAVIAHHIKLSADGTDGNGQINVSGTLNADTAHGSGLVELYALNNININDSVNGGTGKISARGTDAGAKGGDVILSSEQGTVNIYQGGNVTAKVSAIDVSSSGGTNGTVYLRAERYQNNSTSDNDVKINLANGSIADASAVYAEAVKTYNYSTDINSSDYLTSWLSDATSFYNSNTVGLGTKVGSADFHLLPGVEVVTTGNHNITWNAAWDQGATGIRFGDEPGVLTLRAGGNLNIQSNLVDHPSNMGQLGTANPDVRNSWGFNLVAGANTASADYMAVTRGSSGDLNLLTNLTVPGGTGALVYTENAPILFASGRDTVIGSGVTAQYMINYTMNYNLASFNGSIQGSTGRDLIINGGAIQTATGNIGIAVGRDLELNGNSAGTSLGAIRTTGNNPYLVWNDTKKQYLDASIGSDSSVDPANVNGSNLLTSNRTYYRYAGGGDITLDVGRYAGSFNGSRWTTAESSDAWDYFTLFYLGSISKRYYDLRFSANYDKGTAGLATMGGGDLFVRTGGDFLSQAGTFGTGNLAIYSGGDIRGRFLNKLGQGEIHAIGNLGSAAEPQQVELFNSVMNVTALGDIQVGAVVNPTLASNQIATFRSANFVDCTYTSDTSISLKAGGDVTIAGNSPFYHQGGNLLNNGFWSETVLPANVSVDAGGNIFLLNSLTMTSSPTGKLSLVAEKGDISGFYQDAYQTVFTARVLMSDIATSKWYGLFNLNNDTTQNNNQWLTNRVATDGSAVPNNHSSSTVSPLHSGDLQAIEIKAGGDIKDLKLYLPKMAEVTAGHDITNITYEGQNTNADDVSIIRAGNNISMQYLKASEISTASSDQQPHDGMIQGGPGVFIVQAGGSIDLGSLQDGIQAVGNGSNPLLGTEESSLIILSGYTVDRAAANISGFFSGIRSAGDNYAQMMNGGRLDDAAALLQKTRDDTIIPFLGAPSGTGDINMTSSQISTSIGKSDIYVVANGRVNLGKTALPASNIVNPKTGITTGGGGAINIFAEKDVNVNESRLMTFYGGDITVWSDEGSINAGRGSRTAVSASPPKRQTINGVTVLVFSPPAIGSGIRAVTFGDNPPSPGNIHLFAPTGIIDAGEAGISGGQVILAATQVVNASNISFSAGSVGVPVASTSTTSIGTLSGAGSVTTGSQMMSDASGIAGTKAQASQMLDDIITKWVDVKIIDFIENE